MQTKTFQSDAVSGASFTLAVPGAQMRNRIELSICDLRHEQTLVENQRYVLVPEEYRVSEQKMKERFVALNDDERAKLLYLKHHQDLLVEAVRIAYAKEMIRSFILPGQDYVDLTTKDELLEHGPVTFTQEILQKTEDLCNLRPEEAKN